jgi:P27 family predicted phage terminase small subunit
MARKPKPTKLKILRGDPGKRNAKKKLKAEPQPEISALDPPPGLSKVALAVWKRKAPALARCGILTVTDRDTLERYCHTTDLWHQCRESIAANGLSSATAAGGSKGNPELQALRGFSADLLAIEREFGMTPASRSGMVVNREEAADPLDVFLRATS